MTDAIVTEEKGKPKLTVIYDGDCPFCSSYVRHTRLKKQFSDIELISARSGHPKVREIEAQGYDLNEGMAVLSDGALYYGADAMNFIALATTRSDIFNKAVASVMSHQGIARVLYPFLNGARKMTLFFLRIPQIGKTPREAEEL